MNEKKITVAEPTFKKLRELKKLGFDLSDINKYNVAYANALQDESKLSELAEVLFIEKLSTEDIDGISPQVLWDGLESFFGKCKLRIMS